MVSWLVGDDSTAAAVLPCRFVRGDAHQPIRRVRTVPGGAVDRCIGTYAHDLKYLVITDCIFFQRYATSPGWVSLRAGLPTMQGMNTALPAHAHLKLAIATLLCVLSVAVSHDPQVGTVRGGASFLLAFGYGAWVLVDAVMAARRTERAR